MIAGRKTSTFPREFFFKIPQRARVVSIPLAALLKTHLGVEVDPQDQGRNEVCFFFNDPVFHPFSLIPDPKISMTNDP